MGLDFPFVDTIPLDEQRSRANQVAELATDEDVVDRIDREVAFQSDTVRGKYWRGVQLIEIGTNPDERFLTRVTAVCAQPPIHRVKL